MTKEQDHHLSLEIVKIVKIVVIRNTIQDQDRLRLNGHPRRLILGSKSLPRKRRTEEISRLTVASLIEEIDPTRKVAAVLIKTTEDNETKTMTAKRIPEGRPERRKKTRSLLKSTLWRVCENFSS